MVAGYLFRGSPSVGHTGAVDTAAGRRSLHLNDHTEATAGALGVSGDAGLDTTQEAAIGTDEQQQAATTSSASSATGSGAGGAGGGGGGEVHEHDARHPRNLDLIIQGQSHHEEHKATMLQNLMHGRLHELMDAATGSSSSSSSLKGGKATRKGKQAAAAAAAAGSRGVAGTGSGADKLAAAAVAGDKAKQSLAAAGKQSARGGKDTTTSSTTAVRTSGRGGSGGSSAAAAAAARGAASGTGGGGGGNGGGAASALTQAARYGSALPGCKAAGQGCGLPGHTIHTLFTSNGSPYQNFQARIMLATWHLVRQMPGGEHLVALTRILHRTTPDELMDEVDTFRAQPLQPECDKWCWFPVADRANAVHQWLNLTLKQPSMQKAPWLLLLETDYVWIKPLPAPGDAYDPKVPGLSFAFDYIGVKNNRYVAQMLKDECPSCSPDTVPNSGPAPVLARFEDFKAATPLWEKLSLWIETHEEVRKGLGWVREMYAWDIGVAANRLNILNQGPPHTPLISQPPHDHFVHNATMYHYTWGSIFKKDGKEIWKFDKRTYVDPKIALKVPLIPLPPPWEPGVILHDGQTITKDLHFILSDMITHMNAGIATLPDLTGKKVQAA